MELNIHKDITIGELQDEFSKRFNFLKLGFFIDKNNDNRLTADEQVKNRHIKLESIRDFQIDGDITIKASMTAGEVEKKFKEHFGVDVQILRQSGLNWLVTSQTDEWTLEEQNQKAMEMSKPVDAPEPTDYQEHD
jgi:hypothetical protein